MMTKLTLRVRPEDHERLVALLVTDPRFTIVRDFKNPAIFWVELPPALLLDPYLPLIDLKRQLHGVELTAVGLLMDHPWIRCLGDCAYVTSSSMKIIPGMGIKRLAIVKGLLGKAGVDLASQTGDTTGWRYFERFATPPDKFLSITLRRAGRGITAWPSTSRGKHSQFLPGDWTTLAEAGWNTLGDLIDQTPTALRAKLQKSANTRAVPLLDDVPRLTHVLKAVIDHYKLAT